MQCQANSNITSINLRLALHQSSFTQLILMVLGSLDLLRNTSSMRRHHSHSIASTIAGFRYERSAGRMAAMPEAACVLQDHCATVNPPQQSLALLTADLNILTVACTWI